MISRLIQQAPILWQPSKPQQAKESGVKPKPKSSPRSQHTVFSPTKARKLLALELNTGEEGEDKGND